MNDKLIRQITGEIAEALVSRKLAAIPNRKAAQALLKSCGMAESLAALFPIRERLSCVRVLELCAPVLERLCPQGPESSDRKHLSAMQYKTECAKEQLQELSNDISVRCGRRQG